MQFFYIVEYMEIFLEFFSVIFVLNNKWIKITKYSDLNVFSLNLPSLSPPIYLLQSKA